MKKNEHSKKFDAKFNEAIALKNSNKLEESLKIFINLTHEYPEYFLSYVFIGLLYWDLKKLNEATGSFKKAIELNPNSQKASIGYFHLLWEQGKQDEAINELKRFLNNNEAKEHRKILEELENKSP